MYKIYPIHLGTQQVQRSLYEYRYPGTEKIDVAYGCYLIRGNGKTILFDSGIPDQQEMHRIGYVFGYMDGAPYVLDELKKLGVEPEDVDTIIVSHLHWDHAWNLEKYPNAKIYIQKKELQHAVAPNPHERPAYGLTQGVPGNPGWFGSVHRIIPLNGDCEILEGIQVITTPGHTPGSQSAVVKTEVGPIALVSDFALTYRCYSECVLTGIFTSADEWYDSYDKIQKIQPAVVLTTHDLSSYARKCYG